MKKILSMCKMIAFFQKPKQYMILLKFQNMNGIMTKMVFFYGEILDMLFIPLLGLLMKFILMLHLYISQQINYYHLNGASVTVSGNSLPDDSQTYDIVCSFAKSINWRCEQLLYRKEWVFEATRRARNLAAKNYEIYTQLLSDPSGVSTQRPDQIQQASATCSNCAYYFDQYFKATSSGSTYTAVGYNTDSSSGNLKEISDLSELVPIANYQDSQPSSNSITLTFSGYEEHYLYSVLLYSAAETDLETITSDQIISGLDYQNKDALLKSALTWPKGPDSSNYEEITTMELTYSSLKTVTDYAICVVAVNFYTSITDPLTNFDTVDLQKCYTMITECKHEEECTGISCSNSHSKRNEACELYIRGILTILALLFA